ncbi:phosphoribosyltransferase family protein [Kibdelosporangium phytohabitans]|uniref:Adenine phosphoribosyltransferase n=1 Tax=Kibdelosporangium phytohabitans TaxID=860235 RepID=A0A0N9HX14_9PSEU|nr:phosphoribosyltransferase family protein [Kibdelosporangium phytohabitans]ALG11948.1 adenine phosphoribosyltransferase [Kibdelosporangium phytohabitans]MBE1463404.1 adenine phosphoribosyltransferase [Kibdelosporangium phytohabitans]
MRTEPDVTSEVRDRLRRVFFWHSDRTDESWYADMTSWWRSPTLLRSLGPALASLFRDGQPTVVLGVESSGCLLGPLVAVDLGIGFVEVRKRREQVVDSDAWRERRSPPDYSNRHRTLAFRKRLVGPADRVLVVDDWITTGGQVSGVRSLVHDAEATWLGAAVVVDALMSNETRRLLGVRSLLHIRDL